MIFVCLIADGICDDEANTPECVYDVGDCCWHKNDYSQCLECHCFQEKDLDVEAFKLSASTAFCHDSKLSLLGKSNTELPYQSHNKNH